VRSRGRKQHGRLFEEPGRGPSDWDVAAVGPGSSQGGSNYRQIRGVSCPTVQLCVAVSFEGFVFSTEDPGGGAAAWKTVDLDPAGPNTHLYGISCPTAQFCVASAGGAKILTSADPTGDASSWQRTEIEGPLELRGVSCASAAFCTVVGDDGDNIRPGLEDHGVILTSTNPMVGEWQRAQPPINGNAYGVACPSAGLCVSGDLLGDLLVSTAPSSPTSWSSVKSGGTVQITDVDCPTTALCAAVDLNGGVITSGDPTGGAAAWSLVNLAPYPAWKTPGERDVRPLLPVGRALRGIRRRRTDLHQHRPLLPLGIDGRS
jgi:hypothetical protein